MQSKVKFADEKIKKAFEELKTQDPKMHKIISQTFENIELNAFCGIQIPKRLIPKQYIQKSKVKNLWKCNLPNA